MQHVFKLLAVGWCLAVLWGVPLPAAAQTGGIVRQIVVEGAQRIEPTTIRSYLLIQEGDYYSVARVDRSLKSLFATGLFADVTMSRRGDTLVVSVVENPIINRISFEGNSELDDDLLTSEVILRPRVIYTRIKVLNDVKRLLTLYQRNGHFGATVDPKVIRLPQNRVDVAFEISEGEPTEIQSIRFVGNRRFSDTRLREAVRTKESRWWRFLSTDDTYDPDRLTLDRELLRRFYLKNGYADFRVLSSIAELSPDRKDFFVTFTVEEGRRYQFGAVSVEARLRGLDAKKLRRQLDIDRGDWYDSAQVEAAIDQLTDSIGTLGYAFVEIRPRINRNRETRKIDVAFEVNEGPRVFVERIEITGNVRTVDDVIRREFRLVEGDAFNSAKLRRSRTRIQNLDFFETVKVQRIPGSDPDKTVVKVDVTEKSTGAFSVGAGFSTTNGPLADFSIRERNLLGRGLNLRLNATLAARRSEIDLSFTEPYFLGREVSAGFDVFRVTTDRQDTSSFDSEYIGGKLRLGYPITENLNQSWGYAVRQSEITDIDANASPLIRAAGGKRVTSAVSHSLSYDRRDSRIFPTKGYVLRMGNEVAGLGGDTNYLRLTGGGAKFFPLADDWVLAFSLTGGYIIGLGEDVHLLDRFFAGGDNLRGFTDRGIGPRDKATKDALGGEWTYSGTVELRFPVGLPAELGVEGRLFTDLGSVGNISPSAPNVGDTGSVRVSIGTGLSWLSPFGPIGIDVGFPVVKEDFDEEELIRINFGTRF